MKKRKGNWIVRVEVVYIKDIFCENCTEAQAKAKPFEHFVDEICVDVRSYEVLSVKPTE